MTIIHLGNYGFIPYGKYPIVACDGVILVKQVVLQGTLYRCSRCGKEFVVDLNGDLVLS